MYTEKEPVFSNPGERYKTTYHLIIDSNGVEKLEPDGQTDVYEMIQSYAPSVDLDLILQRYANGDVNALERAQAMYADISDVPVDMRELLNLNIRAREYFDSLEPEYRQIYGNDYNRFITNPEEIVNYMVKKEQAELSNESAKEVEKVDVNSEQ